MGYAAFLSYHRESDRRLARALRSGLQSFARRPGQLRALSVCLDE